MGTTSGRKASPLSSASHGLWYFHHPVFRRELSFMHFVRTRPIVDDIPLAFLSIHSPPGSRLFGLKSGTFTTRAPFAFLPSFLATRSSKVHHFRRIVVRRFDGRFRPLLRSLGLSGNPHSVASQGNPGSRGPSRRLSAHRPSLKLRTRIPPLLVFGDFPSLAGCVTCSKPWGPFPFFSTFDVRKR